MNIKKRCNKIGCNEYISIDKTYCKRHTNYNHKQYEQIRTSTKEGREYKRFYSSDAWRELRYQALLRDEFLCVMCKDKGIYKEATIGDHIIPTKVRWDLRLDINNIQSLCFECHNKKTDEDKKKYNI